MKALRQAGIAGLLLLLALTAGGCGDSKKKVSQDRPGEEVFEGAYIISAADAAKKAGDKNVQFLDGRGWKKALLGTVEGAVATDWQELALCDKGEAGDESWGLLPEPGELAKRLGKLGLSKDKEIIVLGEPEGGWGEDGRIVWELLQAGFRNVRFVDGGYSTLKDAGVPTQHGASKAEKTEVEIAELDISHSITTEELLKNYKNYKIVDARTKEEYEGAVLHDEAKGGHLPGAVNIPFTELFAEDGTLKSKEKLTGMFEAAGLGKDEEIVLYCTGGIRSGYMQLVMEMCGYTHTYNYGQSFWRWSVVGEVEK